MVRWFDPLQMIDTAKRVVFSERFAAYADQREVQALVPAVGADYSGRKELWFDHVADLGDGWDPTYTIARLLAADTLTFQRDDGEVLTQRGQVLVMGGDQVYPVPTEAGYENRFLGPYRSALPCPSEDGPDLFAIPGSYDWYDGLLNFRKVFCRQHWIGGWRTRQRRSYFALQLPHGWWLWGVDLQFGDALDEAQWAYFAAVAEDMQPGGRVVLCMPKEADHVPGRAEAASRLTVDHLERTVIEEAGGRVVVYLTSSLHYYSRYEGEGGQRHHVRSGGGGAFLHPTHHLPEAIELPGAHGPTRYHRTTTYPSAAVSRRLRKWVWVLPFFNLPLAATFGAIQVIVAWVLGLHLDDRHVDLGAEDLWHSTWGNPLLFLLVGFTAALVAGLVRFAESARHPGTRVLVGTTYAAAQGVTIGAAMIAASKVTPGTGPGPTTAFFVLVGVFGGLASSFAFSAYLWLTNHFGMHDNEAYAPLHHKNYKHFLRFHIDHDGALTMFPIAVDRVGRRWRLAPHAAPQAPWFEADGPEPQPHLIEEPLVLQS